MPTRKIFPTHSHSLQVIFISESTSSQARKSLSNLNQSRQNIPNLNKNQKSTKVLQVALVSLSSNGSVQNWLQCYDPQPSFSQRSFQFLQSQVQPEDCSFTCRPAGSFIFSSDILVHCLIVFNYIASAFTLGILFIVISSLIISWWALVRGVTKSMSSISVSQRNSTTWRLIYTSPTEKTITWLVPLTTPLSTPRLCSNVFPLWCSPWQGLKVATLFFLNGHPLWA